jgi:hypothetical protein
MKLANGILTFTLAACTGPLAFSQPTPDATTTVRTFYLNNTVQGTDDAHEILNALRTTMKSHDTVYLDDNQSAIVVRATPEDLATAQKVIDDLDRPKKTYRLTYTVTELEGTRRMDAQRYAMVLAPTQRTTLSESTKVPIATGIPTQFTYYNVGMTFDATITEMGKGVRLQSKVQQTSDAAPVQPDAQTKADATLPPVMRNANLEGAAFLTAGKPITLGSLDIPGSTRRLEVEVVMEEIH